MAAKEKFMNFLESIKTEENSKLIENVVKGFNACLEYGPERTFIGGATAAMPMTVNIPSRVREYTPEAEPEVEVEEEELTDPDPESVVAAMGNPENRDVAMKIAQDIRELIKNPEIMEMLKEEMRKMGEI